MRLSYFALWIAVIFVANVGATSNNRPKRIRNDAISLRRSLRVHEIFNEKTEERGVFSSLTEKTKSLLTSKTSATTVESLIAKNRSPKDALTRLQLSKAGTNLLEKPQFKTWIYYMEKLNKENPDEVIIATLKSQYKFSDDVLSRMIIKAKRNPETKDIATKLQEAQLKIWNNAQTQTDDVFKLLQLNRAGRSPFKSPEFSVWTKYLHDIKAPYQDKIILSTLSSHYTDDVVSQMLISARKRPETEEMATKLQLEQLQVWTSKGTPTDDVYNFLQLNRAGDKLFDTPEFALWVKYLDDRVVTYKDKIVFSTLSAHYSDDVLSQMIVAAKKIPSTENIATKLQADQLRVWLSKEKSADDVFKLLQLNKADDKLFDSSEFTLWSKYLDDLGLDGVNKEKTIAASLSDNIPDESLLKLIDTARITKNRNLAKKIEEAQYTRWLETNTHPDDIFVLYQLNTAGDNLIGNPRLKYWINYKDDFNNKNVLDKASTMKTFTDSYGDAQLAKIIIAAKGVKTTEKRATDLQREQLKYWLDNRTPTTKVYTWLGVSGTKHDDPIRLLFREYQASLAKAIVKDPIRNNRRRLTSKK
ncbi:RxLR effector protein [Phytophthora megakarya]|uniref:RxLR effector protein n=1 Tax=Phytophthora megakarya TaxID=4795 RepID=A0A225VSB5_9STRA|nr:RxLR effector protein [Phytophthora megakarya]